jgi:beta-ureidopropionase / N-carbamoyl-L-amino-acid hydrolase
MPDKRSLIDGTRVLADLNALRSIGAYKTGVHKPTFSEPHKQSLEWLAGKLPKAGVCTENLSPEVVVMESAEDGARLYASGPLNRANNRRVFVQ